MRLMNPKTGEQGITDKLIYGQALLGKPSAGEQLEELATAGRLR